MPAAPAARALPVPGRTSAQPAAQVRAVLRRLARARLDRGRAALLGRGGMGGALPAGASPRQARRPCPRARATAARSRRRAARRPRVPAPRGRPGRASLDRAAAGARGGADRLRSRRPRPSRAQLRRQPLHALAARARQVCRDRAEGARGDRLYPVSGALGTPLSRAGDHDLLDHRHRRISPAQHALPDRGGGDRLEREPQHCPVPAPAR